MDDYGCYGKDPLERDKQKDYGSWKEDVSTDGCVFHYLLKGENEALIRSKEMRNSGWGMEVVKGAGIALQTKCPILTKLKF